MIWEDCEDMKLEGGHTSYTTQGKDTCTRIYSLSGTGRMMEQTDPKKQATTKGIFIHDRHKLHTFNNNSPAVQRCF